jgi:hypothetical protein
VEEEENEADGPESVSRCLIGEPVIFLDMLLR